MGRPRKDKLPKHLYRHPLNHAYYYKNPDMPRKANLGKDRTEAIQLAGVMNSRYRTRLVKDAIRLEAAIDIGSPPFGEALEAFVERYIADYRLKASTAALLRQRRKRLAHQIGDVQVAVVNTQMLREAIAGSSQFEQGKMRTLLRRFFSYAKSHGVFPSHLGNPVDDLFVDPVPQKRRRRMTLEQFQAIHAASPAWMQWLMTLGFHLALRRVDFPVHPDVERVIAAARRSSMRIGRCPFIVHRMPERRTGRAAQALASGRMEHSAQVLPDYATKAFKQVRQRVCMTTGVFAGLAGGELPTLHEIRALSSHLYASAVPAGGLEKVF